MFEQRANARRSARFPPLSGALFLHATFGNATVHAPTLSHRHTTCGSCFRDGNLASPSTVSQMRLIAIIAAAALLMTACASPQTDEPEFNLSGYPPAFRDGYTDGCNSTRRPDSTVRDESRFKTDSIYATGWRDGFDMCSQH